jgi:flagellar motor switch/type III secretory pathway protein FliN
LALHYQQKALFNAVFSLAVAGQPSAKELADLQLIQQFSGHILHDLAGRFCAGHTLPDHASGQTQWQLEMILTIARQPIVVRLSAARVKSVLTQSQGEKTNAAAVLIPQLQALHAEQIDITPNISSVVMPLKQLLNLQVGSVIKLSQPIAKPIPLSSNGKVITMAGYLVNQHGNKALYLTGNTHEQH